ncbi:MAG TPA: rod shape-determining protein MreC [Chloroflexota bacterium]|nr:rod shape-determining protein MreC [Chloroflexota bacterium]
MRVLRAGTPASGVSGAPANPLMWLALFVVLSVGATVADSQRLLDGPRQLVLRVLAPVQAGVSRVGHSLSGVTSGWSEVSQLREENAALRRTVEELLQETVNLRAAELENRELREQLRYARANPSRTLVPAEVIGLDSSALLGYATLNRGTEAGVQIGMTVQTTGGLIGRVVAGTATTSRVLLINHPSSAVNARIQNNPGATGQVLGQADGRLVMRYIPQAETVRVNDVVVTSGLGGAFPPNVPIGRVAHVETRDVDLFQRAVVEPFVNFGRLGHVIVDTGFLPTKL